MANRFKNPKTRSNYPVRACFRACKHRETKVCDGCFPHLGKSKDRFEKR